LGQGGERRKGGRRGGREGGREGGQSIAGVALRFYHPRGSKGGELNLEKVEREVGREGGREGDYTHYASTLCTNQR
jgi:hypothetical protein